MSRWGNNGGWNKQCGTVEATPRIDSYEAGSVEGWGCLFAYREKGLPLVLDCNRYMEYWPEADREIVEVWHPKEGWSQELELSRKANGFGGSQAFFLCPICGARVRYLYCKGWQFVCRKCARLNYRSQQETRSDSMYYFHKGRDLVQKHLEPPSFPVDGFSFCRWLPERPRYMHKDTYRRYLAWFLRYREKHSERQMADMLRLLRMFK